MVNLNDEIVINGYANIFGVGGEGFNSVYAKNLEDGKKEVLGFKTYSVPTIMGISSFIDTMFYNFPENKDDFVRPPFKFTKRTLTKFKENWENSQDFKDKVMDRLEYDTSPPRGMEVIDLQKSVVKDDFFDKTVEKGLLKKTFVDFNAPYNEFSSWFNLEDFSFNRWNFYSRLNDSFGGTFGNTFSSEDYQISLHSESLKGFYEARDVINDTILGFSEDNVLKIKKYSDYSKELLKIHGIDAISEKVSDEIIKSGSFKRFFYFISRSTFKL